MKLEEYKNMTDEERLNLFNELEEEKEFLDKALEKFLHISKKDKPEKWISLSGYSGGAIKVSDIDYIEALASGSFVITKKIRNGKNISFQCEESPEELVEKINKE